MKVLVVEDDRDLVELLTFTLGRAGFETLVAHEPDSALTILRENDPDLVLLDINLGGWNGLDLLAEVRRMSRLPVILLTARDREDDKVRGLEAGADDYVTKPFSHRELIARIRARLRTRGPAVETHAPAAALQVGPVLLNAAEHAAALDGHELSLTVTEFRLLHYLMSRANTAVPAKDVLRHVWGYSDGSGAETLRMAISRLRRKLGETAEQPRLLHTVTGVGFALRPPPSEPGTGAA